MHNRVSPAVPVMTSLPTQNSCIENTYWRVVAAYKNTYPPSGGQCFRFPLHQPEGGGTSVTGKAKTARFSLSTPTNHLFCVKGNQRHWQNGFQKSNFIVVYFSALNCFLVTIVCIVFRFHPHLKFIFSCYERFVFIHCRQCSIDYCDALVGLQCNARVTLYI